MQGTRQANKNVSVHRFAAEQKEKNKNEKK